MVKKSFKIHILADSTGNLAQHMLNSVLTQFDPKLITVRLHRFLKNEKAIQQVVSRLKGENLLILHTFVCSSNKQALESACLKNKIPSFDLTGSLVNFISTQFKLKPNELESKVHSRNKGYFERIRAMEFTAQHDDGRRIEGVKESDIIIFGISRVSKSPTSTFLGSMGYKVSNVAVTMDMDLKKDFKGLKSKAIALTIQPKALQDIRKKRFDRFKIKDLNYTDIKEIIQEIMHVESQYEKMGWPVLDITGMTIEETAAKILEIKKIKRKDYLNY